MTVTLPELSLVVLVGPSGSGKSTFAQRHFLPTEIVSSDRCRGMVSDDENSQEATEEAFELLHFIIRKRLELGRLTVVDATNVAAPDRRKLVELARAFHVLPAAIVFKLPEPLCQERNRGRQDREFGPHVIRRQIALLRRGLRGLKREGFRTIVVLENEAEVAAVDRIERQPLWNNRRAETGPFDIIGDVHGCIAELDELLVQLGYHIGADRLLTHPEGRKPVFLGDLIDRGPDSPSVLRLVMRNVAAGHAHCVPGNHDVKLLKYLQGRKAPLTHGLDATLVQLAADPIDHRDLAAFLDALVSHYVFDDGKLVIAHAGLKEEMQGRGSGRVREFCLYGETTGERDEFGLPERLDWAAAYRGRALVVYGHTPFHEPRWLNHTVNIDTGCAFGGRLTALRYPELDTFSVTAHRTYAEPARPLQRDSGLSSQQEYDALLDLSDVLGKQRVHTDLIPSITVLEENAAAALEVISRFAVDPRWLIYLPPTMSPCSTSEREGWLERPEEAFHYYRKAQVDSVVCEEKHMGSRAVVVVCRNHETALQRFGIDDGFGGACYTRTGRPFFTKGELLAGLLDRLRLAAGDCGWWEELETDWLCLDCELMPWSVKARELLASQYAPVGAAGEEFCAAAGRWAQQAANARHLDEGPRAAINTIARRMDECSIAVSRYRTAYGHYCWDVAGLDGIKLAPFHLLASEGKVHTDRPHAWHMTMGERMAAADPALFQATRWREVALADEADVQSAVDWWEAMTSQGGEGMVVKPSSFVATGPRGLIQPAVKVRGPEYLRIIYGPHYDAPENLARLRPRGLGRKRSLASREFALGLQALHGFVGRNPLRVVHQCVFAVLALESEPMDPRL